MFLSYAREDADSARRIADALRACGVEVWFDQNELRGGDAWDQKIRQQIHDCALFVPFISGHTQTRKEGYFRREWKQAVERLEDIAEGVPFVVPICLDETPEKSALVPRAFRQVQWTRLKKGDTPADLVQRIQHLLLAKDGPEPPAAVGAGPGAGRPATLAARRARPVSAKQIFLGVLAVLLLGFAAWKWLPRPAGVAATATPLPPTPAVGNSPLITPKLSPPAAPTKSVAVLAFKDLSEDRKNEFFSEGISEELLNVLAKVPGLRVAARASAFYFKGKDVQIKQIGEELGVAHLVDGSVRRDGNRVRITAQLIQASDGYQLWSEQFDRDLKDIFAVQDEIAGVIAKNLQLTLSGARATKVVNPDAHRLVIEARHFWNLRTEEAFVQADRVLAQALQIDPQFAEAHAALADLATVRGWYRLLGGAPNAADDFVQARGAVRRAQELDPLLAGPYSSLGAVLYNEGRFAESDEQFQRAFALNPNYALAHHWHAHLLSTRGRPDLALAALERSLSLDPLNAATLAIYALHLDEARRPAEALAACDRVLAIRPHIFLPIQGERAMALTLLGRAAEGVENARKVVRNPTHQPRWWSDPQALYCLRKAGLQAEAADYAAQLLRTLPPDSSVRGFVLAALDRHEEALPYLATTAPSSLTRFFYWPMWDAVRNDPRLPGLLAKAGCYEEYKLARETLARSRKAGDTGRTRDPGPPAKTSTAK